MENRYHLSFWKCLGANPTPMNFSKVYIGLQQKTIDAQENPCEVIASNRLYEQQDYVIETNHLPHLISLIVSEKSALYTSHFPIATPLRMRYTTNRVNKANHQKGDLSNENHRRHYLRGSERPRHRPV